MDEIFLTVLEFGLSPISRQKSITSNFKGREHLKDTDVPVRITLAGSLYGLLLDGVDLSLS